MPDEETLNADINTIADLTADRPADDTSAEQGPAPSQLHDAPHLQTIQPGEHLDAAQVEEIMGDEKADEEKAQQANRALEQREGIDPDTES